MDELQELVTILHKYDAGEVGEEIKEMLRSFVWLLSLIQERFPAESHADLMRDVRHLFDTQSRTILIFFPTEVTKATEQELIDRLIQETQL